MKVVLVLWGQPDVLGTCRELWGREWGRFWTLLYPGSVCSVCAGPDTCVPSLWTCASQSWLVHLKASALLGSQFFRLFVVNYVPRADGFCFLNWAVMLVFSVEVLYKSGSPTSLPVSPFSGASSSTEFHLTCDPPGILAPVCHLPRQCTAFCRLQQEKLLLRSQRAFFWW